MDKMENYDQQYAEYYQTEYESVLSRFEEYQKLHSHHTQSKIRKDFKSRVSSEMKSIVEKEEPSSIPNATVVRENKYKSALIERFKFREDDYSEKPVTSFLKEVMPLIRQEHLDKFRSGNYKNDYEWDTAFIENHSIDDVLHMLAKYFALDDYRKELIGKEVSKNQNPGIVSIKASGLNVLPDQSSRYLQGNKQAFCIKFLLKKIQEYISVLVTFQM